ncbi:MAG: restriction endonuclease subunit S [Treponema sp.]|nr:restriction endonuclease subunit S [Treponema sp.]
MAQIKKDTTLRKSILQAAITGQLISDIGGESLPLAAAGKPSSATPSPRGYAPKTPNEFASFENQNSVSERSERPTLPETGKQLLDRIIEERNKKLLADWEEALKKNVGDKATLPSFASKTRAKKPALVVASEIDEDEIPFEIPENWCWCRLGDICLVKGGKRIPAGCTLTDIDTGHKYIRVADMKNGSVIVENVKYITDEIHDKIKAYKISKDDVYITVAGTIGDSGIIPDELDNANLTENADKLVLFNGINKYCLHFFLSSGFFQEQISDAITKVGQPKLAIIRIQNFLLPLPPLAVQNAIVAKLEQVLPLVDAYENAVLQKEELKSTLSDKVKKAILQEAITGKLTETWRKSATIKESGKQLLDRIIEERNAKALADWEEALKKNPKAKKPVPVVASEIEEEEIPFEVPESWCWCHLGEIFKVTMGQSPEGSNVGEEKEGMEFHQGKIFFTDKYIATSNQKTSEITKIAEPGSILLCMRAPVGKVNITDRQICIGRGLSSIVPLGEIALEWAFHLFETLESDFIDKSTGSTFKAITGDVVKEQLIPLPPLEEQEEIVKKMEVLLQLCK